MHLPLCKAADAPFHIQGNELHPANSSDRFTMRTTWYRLLTLSSLSLPLSSSSTISRELLSQISTCSGWRWLEVGVKREKILLLLTQFNEVFGCQTPKCRKLKSFFRDVKWCFDASWGFNYYSSGTNFRRQNLTPIDVILWRPKSIPAQYGWKYLSLPQTHNIGIQINRKELTKTFMMISNWKNTCVSMVYIKYLSALRAKGLTIARQSTLFISTKILILKVQ